jgi:uncharacterized GH25 family protein
METIRQGYPALQLIFLMALAEGVVKFSLKRKKLNPLDAIKIFFSHISAEDKKMLMKRCQRASISANLRFSSILKILYEVRNRAVHGESFWDFSLMDKAEKEKNDKIYTDYSLITSGALGKKGKKRRVSLETALTYEELKQIFIRTALANIENAL